MIVKTMTEEPNIYSGICKYKDINFTFIFDGEKLYLIPPSDKEDLVWGEWIFSPLTNGAYTIRKPLTIDEPYLTGKCNETGTRLIFITRKGGHIGSQNHVLFVPIIAYIRCKYDRDSIARMSFSTPVINCIHPVNRGVEYSVNVESYDTTGVFSVTTQSFEETTTAPQVFTVDDKQVSVKFSITRKLSTKLNEPPIMLNSTMLFEFESTNNYGFIYRLWYIAKQFLQYLCYRKNIFLPESALSAISRDGKYEGFATLSVLNESGDAEPKTLKSGRYIKQINLSGAEGKILTDIANGTLYLRHIPHNYRSGRSIDASRFVMIMAAFEWEFRRSYPGGVTKREATIKAEDAVAAQIQKLMETADNGKQHSIYKFLQRLVKSDSLESEIIHTGKEIDTVIGDFGKHLYNIYGYELNYSQMGKRLSSQRNNYAHGNLDKEFIGPSLLDLMYMEYVIYTMQLKYYGIDTINIRHAVNDLFHLNFAIK